jgi:hypothetical protein
MMCPKCESTNVVLMPDNVLLRLGIISKIYFLASKYLKINKMRWSKPGRYFMECHDCGFKNVIQIL